MFKVDNDKLILGKYKIKRKIKEGGMDSEIFIVEDIKLNQDKYYTDKYKYAIAKIVNKLPHITNDQWQRLKDETITNARLNKRKNIIETYYSQIYDDHIIIIMEYIDGFTLHDYIIDNGLLSINEAIWIFKNILYGVAEMHNNKTMIIHRDLKPDNVLISKNLLKIKIIDFGISSVVLTKKNKNNKYQILTNEDSFYGTIPYLSPDIINFKNKNIEDYGELITKQFDFHSLGIIFYEMLSGKKPFIYKNEDDPASIKIPLKYDFKSLKTIKSDFPNDLENIIIRLIASKDSDKHLRYNSIEEILADIEKYEKRILNNEPEPDSLKPFDTRILQDDSLFIKKPLIWNYKQKILFFTILANLLFLIIVTIIFLVKL